jgi:phosphatidylglycerophosphate synthase
MAFSVAVFSAVTLASPYPGKSIRGKRLFSFQLLSCTLMIVATWLMFGDRSEWVLAMIAGAVFLLYAAVMMPRELEREKNKP